MNGIVLPVDMPFLPTAFLDDWLWSVLHEPRGDIRIAMFTVDGLRSQRF